MSSLHNDMLHSALDLANHGFHVFPVDREKKPSIKGWTNRTATVDPAIIEDWWGSTFKGANVAVSCGMSDLIVVDVDLRHGGDETIAEWQRKHDTDFIKTVTALSGTGGSHYYFKANGKRYGNTKSKIGNGIDTRGIGGLVVAPYSIHLNGTPYRWDKGYSPDEREMLPLPDFIAEKLPKLREKNINENIYIKKNKSLKITRGLMQVEHIHYLHQLVSDSLERRDLKSLDRNDFFIRAACDFLGVPADVSLGSAFLCVLPGHEESHPSASIHPDKSGVAVYHDWHCRSGCPEFLTLAEVYTAQETGRVQPMKGPWLATWKLRMLIEMGLVEPFPVTMRPLPENASPSLKKVYDGFRFLLGCKWLYSPYEPTPFSHRFAADWCGLAQGTVQKYFQTLYAMGIIERVDSYPGMFGKEMALYLPRGM